MRKLSEQSRMTLMLFAVAIITLLLLGCSKDDDIINEPKTGCIETKYKNFEFEQRKVYSVGECGCEERVWFVPRLNGQDRYEIMCSTER